MLGCSEIGPIVEHIAHYRHVHHDDGVADRIPLN
jgi:hypothetical protein